MAHRYPHLLSPGRIGTLELKNRIAVSAMGVSLSEEDGTVGERIIAYHEEQARGGAGLIVSGVTGVAWPVGAVAMQQTAISDDRFIPGLAQLCSRVHAAGAKIAAQLHHGGLVARYGFTRHGNALWAPSPPQPPKGGDFVNFFLMEELAGMAGPPPEIRVIDQADIDLAVAQFAAAARRARDAGFDGVEIHAGHGYLLSSFISPATNTRTDGYGGSRENRMRLPLEVIAAIRREVGRDFPVWIKLDTRELGKDGGITLDDAVEHAKMVEAAGADAIVATCAHNAAYGKLHSESNIPHVENWNLPAAATMRRAVSIPVFGLGRIEPDSAEAALAGGEVDFIAMGRKLLADPYLPARLAAGTPEKARPCVYCYTCVSAIYTGEPARCAVNADLGREYLRQRAGPAKHVVVVGGGPGGMDAARRLRAAGHRVTLLEQSPRLGGTVRFAGLAYPPNQRLLEWLVREVEASGADIRCNTRATADLLATLAPDHVIVATGAVRAMPAIPGADLPHVFSGDDLRELMFGGSSPALRRKTGLLTRLATRIGAATGITANLDLVRKLTHAWMPLGRRVVILGGELVGIELAEFLHERGRDVTVIEEAPRLGKGLTLVRRMRILSELAEHGVALVAGARDVAISADAVRYTDASGESRTVAADTVIVARGAAGDLTLADELRAAGFAVTAIGDANGVGYIEGATRGAFDAVLGLSGAPAAG
ncbi:MAG: FAD-dependent oxidoreductase [Sphingomonadales bacterium]|nr:FAD-dependent oxidoreductase [Sphingomonadales bacterium]